MGLRGRINTESWLPSPVCNLHICFFIYRRSNQSLSFELSSPSVSHLAAYTIKCLCSLLLIDVRDCTHSAPWEHARNTPRAFMCKLTPRLYLGDTVSVRPETLKSLTASPQLESVEIGSVCSSCHSEAQMSSNATWHRKYSRTVTAEQE